jgi:hypothetical protein
VARPNRGIQFLELSDTLQQMCRRLVVLTEDEVRNPQQVVAPDHTEYVTAGLRTDQALSYLTPALVRIASKKVGGAMSQKATCCAGLVANLLK